MDQVGYELRLAHLEEAIKRIGDQVRRNEERISGITRDQSSQQAVLQSTLAVVGQLRDSIKGMDASLVRQNERFEARLQQVEERVERLITHSQAELRDDILGLCDAVTALRKDVQGLQVADAVQTGSLATKAWAVWGLSALAVAGWLAALFGDRVKGWLVDWFK